MEEDKKEQEEKKEISEGVRSNKTIYIIVIIIFVAVGGFLAYQYYNEETSVLNSSTSDPDSPVARVNGEEISYFEFQNAKDQITASQTTGPSQLEQNEEQLNSQALNSLISRKLLEQRIDSHNIEATQEDIDARLEELKTNFESEEVYQQQLESQGVTEEQIVEQLRFEIEMRQFLETEFGDETFDVTEEQIQQFYEQSVQGSENAPALEEVRDQIEQMVVQQQQQENLNQLIEQMRSEADIEILI